MIVVSARSMVLFVSLRTTQKAKRNNIVKHPSKVVPAVCLCQQVGHYDVVECPSHRMKPKDVEREDIRENL